MKEWFLKSTCRSFLLRYSLTFATGEEYKKKIRSIGTIAAVLWTLLIAYSLFWDHKQHREEAALLGTMQGSALFNKDALYRRWASRHGGVYVPVTESTPPNPYLALLPERDITTPSGRRLTLMNPSYMMRQAFEMAREGDGTGRSHITSLHPLRSENAPDAWEKTALKAFEHGAVERGQFTEIDGKPYYRFMRRLLTEQSCLRCHSSQGYHAGEVSGGLSISVPMEPIYAMMRKEMRGVNLMHVIIWMLGLGAIGFGTRNIEKMTAHLHDQAVDLEKEAQERKQAERVLEDRTDELATNNRVLRTLSECNQALVRVQDEKTLVENMCWIITEHGGYRMALVGYPGTGENETIRLAAQSGCDEDMIEKVKHAWAERSDSRGAIGRAIRERAAVILRNIADDEQYPAAWREAARRGGYAATVGLPLMRNDEVLGGLAIYSVDPSAFSDSEVGLLKELANDMAYGIAMIRAEEAHKRTETAVQESEKKYRHLVENIQEGIWVINENSVTTFINQPMADMLACTVDEALGKHMFSFMDERVAKLAEEHLDKARQGVRELIDFELLRKDGGRFFVSMQVGPVLDSRGGYIGAIAGVIDMTERRKLEEQLRQSQKMEAIGQLAGGVAHDFNNILTAIVGYGSILKMKIPDDDPQQRNVDLLLESAERAAYLTHSLLAFSRKQVMHLKPVRPSDIIARLEKFLRRIIGEDIELKTFLRTDAAVLADTGQIEQVLMNFATNARDAMPRGGYLAIETDVVALSDAYAHLHGVEMPGSYVVISVSDSGSGMDEETKKRIFDPFFTTKEPGKGTGLGLSIVYGIIKQHKGYINLYSQAGSGTRFRIYLPVHQGPVEQHEVLKESEVMIGGTETVLLAEDDPMLRSFFIDILEQSGYRIIVAEDGAHAVDLFSKHKDEIQLCVLDMIMPQKSGRDVYEEIKNDRPDIKVIFMSGYTADKIRRAGIPERCEFTEKPVSPQTLLGLMRNVLDRD